MECKGAKIRDLINKNQLIGPISMVLEKISLQKANNLNEQEIQQQKNGKENCEHFNYENEFDFASFINSQENQENPNFLFYD